MPQNPLAATVAVNPANAQAPQRLDGLGNLRSNPLPAMTILNVVAATVVKAAPGRVGKAQIIVAGSAAGGVYDCLTTAQCTVSTQICSLPPVATTQISAIPVDMMAQVGICILPGTGQTVSLSFE